MADDDDDDDDDENIIDSFADEEEDQQTTAAVALSGAAASSTYIVPAASGAAQPAEELEGNETTPVYRLYKKVMESVFADVRRIVEQEGLEPGVAIELRNRWTERMNRSKVLNHMYTLSEPDSSGTTNAGGGQQYYALQHTSGSTRVSSVPASSVRAVSTGGSRHAPRGAHMYGAPPPTSAPPSYMEKATPGGKNKRKER